MKTSRIVNYCSNRITDTIKTTVKVINPVHHSMSSCTQGIWDTGAVCTAITASVARRLGLTPLGEVAVTTPAGTMMARRYFIELNIEGLDVTFRTVALECEELSGDGRIGMVIGMDIITKGDFLISNHDGKTRMSFRFPAKGASLDD